MGNYLNNFASTYIDNVLIFSNGFKKDYIIKIKKVVKRIAATGLYLNPKKYEFAVKIIKYFGFIVIAGINI